MKILIDTCIILDVLMNREPFYKDSMRVLKYVAEDKIAGYITSCSLRDIYYLVHKHNHSNEKAKREISSLLKIVNVLDVNKEDVINGLESKISDFEDAILEESAKRNQIDAIVTRNINDFKNSSLRILSPEEIK